MRFSEIFPKRLRIYNKNFTRLLVVHTYAKLQNVIQLSPTITKLCRIKHDHPVIFTFHNTSVMPAFEACHRKIFHPLLVEIN